MNNITRIPSHTERMSSREIAEVMNKQHKNVMRDIKKLIDEGAIGVLRFEPSNYLDKQGKTQQEYNLDFQATMTLITGYDAKRRALVIDRWMKLETGEAEPALTGKAKPIDPTAILNDPAAMRGLLLTYTEKVIALEEEKKILEPKAEALDIITHADGENCITDTAKILQVRPKDLFKLMSAERWIYRRAGGKGWIAYQDKIQKGLLTHKVTTVTDIHTGIQKMIEHVLVTSKGLTALSMIVNKAA